MAKLSSRQHLVRFSADNGDSFFRSCLTNFTLDGAAELIETTVMCDDVKNYQADTIEYSVSFDAFLDLDAASYNLISKAFKQKLAVPMEVGPSYLAGAEFQSGKLIIESISFSASTGELQQISVSGKFVDVVDGIRQTNAN